MCLGRFRNSEESEIAHFSERLHSTNRALHCAFRGHFVSDLLAMRLHSMSANATRLRLSLFVISPQGFRLQSDGAIDIAQSPRIEIKKNPRNIEFVFFICGDDWFDTSEYRKPKIPMRFAIKPLYQFLNSFVNSLFHFSASSHCGE